MWIETTIHLMIFHIMVVNSETVIDEPYAWHEWDCPDEKAVFLEQKFVPWGTPLRAYMTFPAILTLLPSKISNAGDGVFSMSFIKAHTWFGEYEGEVLDVEAEISDYAFKVTRNDDVTHYIDALNLDVSTWTRWVNCARTPEEENIYALYCLGKVFYITERDIHPGQELLIYYGDDFAEGLGINTTLFSNNASEDGDNIGNYVSTSELRIKSQRTALKNFK